MGNSTQSLDPLLNTTQSYIGFFIYDISLVSVSFALSFIRAILR